MDACATFNINLKKHDHPENHWFCIHYSAFHAMCQRAVAELVALELEPDLIYGDSTLNDQEQGVRAALADRTPFTKGYSIASQDQMNGFFEYFPYYCILTNS